MGKKDLNEASLAEWEERLKRKEAALNQRETAILTHEGVMEKPQVKREPTKEEKDLLESALKAYGIAPEYMFASAFHPGGKVVIVTRGGKKVRWEKGQEVEPLSYTEVTGELPEQDMVWSERLNGRIDRNSLFKKNRKQ